MLDLHVRKFKFPFSLALGSWFGFELGCLSYWSCRSVTGSIGDSAATRVSPLANLRLLYLVTHSSFFQFECMLLLLNVPALILCDWF